MSVQMLSASRACLSALPRRRVQCACATDLGKRPLLENKVIDVSEPAPFSVPSSFAEADSLLSPEAKYADEWIGATPVVSIQQSTAVPDLEASVPLLPKTTEEAVDKDSDGLGAYLMQTAPVRYVLQGFALVSYLM